MSSASDYDMAVRADGAVLATAGGDGVLRLFRRTADGAGWAPEAKLPEEPCVSLAWAPLALYPSALAACTATQRVVIWSQIHPDGAAGGDAGDGGYARVYSAPLGAAGCCVQWVAPEYGKLFAVGCVDGSVLVFAAAEGDGLWDVHSFAAHDAAHGGCSSLAFAPFFLPGALLVAQLEEACGPDAPPPPLPIAPPRLVTCGGRGGVHVWTHRFEAPAEDGAPPTSCWDGAELSLAAANLPAAAAPPVWREVSWSPNLGLPFTYIAAGAEGGEVAVWRQDGPESAPWLLAMLPRQPAAVTKLSWSQAGSFLLVSCADGTVSMWKETASDGWAEVSHVRYAE